MLFPQGAAMPAAADQTTLHADPIQAQDCLFVHSIPHARELGFKDLIGVPQITPFRGFLSKTERPPFQTKEFDACVRNHDVVDMSS